MQEDSQSFKGIANRAGVFTLAGSIPLLICPDMRGIGVLQIAVGLMWFGAGRGGRPLSKEVTMEWAIGGGILGGIAVIVWYFFTCFLIPFMSNQIGSI